MVNNRYDRCLMIVTHCWVGASFSGILSWRELTLMLPLVKPSLAL